MKATIQHQNKNYVVDFSKPLDISMPLSSNENATRAWYQNPLTIEPVVMGEWVGSVKKGSSVNFNNIFFNPHAHGTHTECVGHISLENESINQQLKQFMFFAEVVTIAPSIVGDDKVILKESLVKKFNNDNKVEAIIIRTEPNTDGKLNHNYSNTNPSYINVEAIEYLNSLNIQHLLLDLPSVDREQDGGELLAHKGFWQYPHNTQLQKTITEMIFVNNSIADGMYLLNIQIAPFENDASPSKPILYALYEKL